jgi:hypothetical protein
MHASVTKKRKLEDNTINNNQKKHKKLNYTIKNNITFIKNLIFLLIIFIINYY